MFPFRKARTIANPEAPGPGRLNAWTPRGPRVLSSSDGGVWAIPFDPVGAADQKAPVEHFLFCR